MLLPKEQVKDCRMDPLISQEKVQKRMVIDCLELYKVSGSLKLEIVETGRSTFS